MLFAVVIGILVVNGIKNRAVDHSWKIASATGAAVCVIVGASGNISLGLHMSYTMMIFSGILGVVIGLFLEVIFFSVVIQEQRMFSLRMTESLLLCKGSSEVEFRCLRSK